MEMLKDLEEKELGIEVEGTWVLDCSMWMILWLARDQVALHVMLDVMGKYVMWWRMVGGKGSGREWMINGVRMENVEVFKYLGVWFGRG